MSANEFSGKSEVDDYRPLAGHQALTPTVATSLTVPGGATFAYITCETQVVRWRDDGTAVTSTTGHVLPVGTPLIVYGSKRMAQLSLIDTAAGAATVRVSYYG